MATYKVKATMLVDVELEVYADSEDEAISKFIRMDARDVIDEAVITDVNTENETAEISEADYLIRVKGINYCVEYEDVADQVAERFPEVEEGSDEFDSLVESEIKKIKESLPQTLDLDLDCVNPNDLDYIISDAISEETGWLINYFESYEVLEVK